MEQVSLSGRSARFFFACGGHKRLYNHNAWISWLWLPSAARAAQSIFERHGRCAHRLAAAAACSSARAAPAVGLPPDIQQSSTPCGPRRPPRLVRCSLSLVRRLLLSNVAKPRDLAVHGQIWCVCRRARRSVGERGVLTVVIRDPGRSGRSRGARAGLAGTARGCEN